MKIIKKVSISDIEAIKAIEKAAYPSYYRQMQDIEDESDLTDYIASSKYIIFIDCEKGWYLIITFSRRGREAEIVDLASRNGIGKDILSCIEYIKKNNVFSRVIKITLDARETTSYPMIKLIRDIGYDVIRDKEYLWCSEKFHEIILHKLPVSGRKEGTCKG